MDTDEIIERYARLAVEVGVNLQPGQDLIVSAATHHLPLARAVVRHGYEAGARHVIANLTDERIRKIKVDLADEDALDWSPPHLLALQEYSADNDCAEVVIVGDDELDLFADSDPARLARSRPKKLVEMRFRQTSARLNAWCIVAFATPGWARSIYGEPDTERLWQDIARATRLHEDDPVASWRERASTLGARAAGLQAKRFDALIFEGPGTDLSVGLHPDGRWHSASFETVRGRKHVANLPTEEVFTSPDFRRVNGTVTSTRALRMPVEAVTVEGLRIRFEGGVAVEVDADTHADVIRATMATDDGASRLGEVALVDRDSAIGRTGMVFNQTLFDENAASHIALGAGFGFAVEGGEDLSSDELVARGVNHSAIHVDFMIGGPEVDVFGVTTEGDRVPVITNDEWRL